jgi:hypothetical protein
MCNRVTTHPVYIENYSTYKQRTLNFTGNRLANRITLLGMLLS